MDRSPIVHHHHLTTLERTMATCESTYQSVALATKEGKAFLRKVLRDNERAGWSDGWTADARESDGWRVDFSRTIKGETGEPDASVNVRTDLVVMLSGKTGAEVASFSDSRPVCVPRPKRLFMHGSDATALVSLLIHGADRLTIHSSSGSTSSSEHGLAFAHLGVRVHGEQYSEVQVGGTTVYKDGGRIVSGSID
jgi:hypothetical protein